MSSAWNQAGSGISSGRRLYRDRENGWIFGVCVGVAEYFGVSSIVVRVLAVLALLLFTVPTALAYVAASLLIPKRPLTYRGGSAEQEFWRRHRNRDHWSST